MNRSILKAKNGVAIFFVLSILQPEPAHANDVLHQASNFFSSVWTGVRILVTDMIDVVEQIFGAPQQVLCPKGSDICASGIPTEFGNFTYRGYQYSFNDGSDYAKNGNLGDQVNKLFGFTDCGHMGKTDDVPSAMIGWKSRINDNNSIDIVGFLNKPELKEKYGTYYEWTPLVTVNRYSLINLSLQKMGPNLEYILFSADGKYNALIKRSCSGSGNASAPERTVTPWFGGTHLAPNDIHMRAQAKGFPAIDRSFPKYLSIGDRTSDCANLTTPQAIALFFNHPSLISSTYVAACNGSLSVSYLGCEGKTRNRDSNVVLDDQVVWKASQYQIDCTPPPPAPTMAPPPSGCMYKNMGGPTPTLICPHGSPAPTPAKPANCGGKGKPVCSNPIAV